MKHSVILLTPLFLLAAACSERFDPYIPSDPIPVVYGMINPADSVFAIRLTKTFVGPGNAESYARIPDSIYYRNAAVWLETKTPGGKLIERADLIPTLIHDRVEGVFATHNNLVYQTDSSHLHLLPSYFLHIGLPYRVDLHLFVKIPGLEDTVHAVSHLQEPPHITQPRYTFTKIYLFTEKPFFMEWMNTYPGNTYEIEVRLHYLERFEDHETEEVARWILQGIKNNETSFPGGSRFICSYYFRPENFYAQIAAQIKPNPDVVVRIAQTLDFTILSSDNQIRFYREVNRITDDYHGIGYSNIDHGLGIFSTYVTTGINGLIMGPQELDSLAMGRYTRHLGFSRWH
ncbi:MAG: DUF4249 family protein [Bacteroidales bacterium]|nr:DUF4249 family protein [Bacteroidales bacterium]